MFYRRRKARLEVSLDHPFPPERLPKPPVNVIQQILVVKAYMQAHPEETCLSASMTLNLHRKRIARLLKLADALPPTFIEKAKEASDPKVLHQMSIKRLLRITTNTPDKISKELMELYAKPDLP